MHCKSSSGSFSISPWHPRTMKPFQEGCCVFLGMLFPTDLGQTLSPLHHFHSSVLTPPQASSSINVGQEQPTEISPNFTTKQDWTHPKLPLRTGISSLDVLLHWRNNLGKVLTPRFCLSGVKSAELKAQSFSGPQGWQENSLSRMSFMTGRFPDKKDADSPFQTRPTYP